MRNTIHAIARAKTMLYNKQIEIKTKFKGNVTALIRLQPRLQRFPGRARELPAHVTSRGIKPAL